MYESTSPTHLFDFAEKIYCIDICKSDFASNLVCVAGDKKLMLGIVRFPEEFGIFAWELLKNIYHKSRCHALCFAPNTSLVVVPKSVTFCAAGADFLLRIFRSDLQNADTVQTLKGHSNYINDVAWDADFEYLASVSDDNSCKIWGVESNYESVTTFCLSSAGMSVKWHAEEPHKVLVAEKRGIIHLYNVRSQQAIISIEAPKGPLMSADWSLRNRFYVTAITAGDLVTWDLRRPTPTTIKQMHGDGGWVVRISPSADPVIASLGRPNITLKVTSPKSTVPLLEVPLKLNGSVVWHSRLPYIGVVYDSKMCFWKIQIK